MVPQLPDSRWRSAVDCWGSRDSEALVTCTTPICAGVRWAWAEVRESGSAGG